MSRTTTAMLGFAVMLTATVAYAQVKVIHGARETTTATVEAMDMTSRRITLRTKHGELRTVQIPPEATRLEAIKPGDTVTATYYENIVVRVKAPSEPDVDTPAGTSGSQRTMTATIAAIDMNEPSIAFKGPRNWSYRTKVMDKNALGRVKVGDRVDLVWTEATLVSVAVAKRQDE